MFLNVNSYTFVGKQHNDKWEKNPDYPDESRRPQLLTYKSVVQYLAFASLGSEPRRCEQEVQAVEWVTGEDRCIERLTFELDKKLVQDLLLQARRAGVLA